MYGLIEDEDVPPLVEGETRVRDVEPDHVADADVVALGDLQIPVLVHHLGELPVRRRVLGHLRETLSKSEARLVLRNPRATLYRFDAEALDALQASLASYLGHLKRASCRRLVAAIWARHAWLDCYFELDRAALRLKRRDRAPQGAQTVLAQYRHWREAFPGDVVLMQIGAFIERLQWPPRRIRMDVAGSSGESGLRRMRATRRGALEGFPISQLRRRVAALLAAGHDVTFIGQASESGTRMMARRPVARWVAASSCRGTIRVRLGRIIDHVHSRHNTAI